MIYLSRKKLCIFTLFVCHYFIYKCTLLFIVQKRFCKKNPVLALDTGMNERGRLLLAGGRSANECAFDIRSAIGECRIFDARSHHRHCEKPHIVCIDVNRGECRR